MIEHTLSVDHGKTYESVVRTSKQICDDVEGEVRGLAEREST